MSKMNEPIRASCGDEAAYKLTRRAVETFFRKNQNPSDAQLHKWAKDNGLDIHDVEEIVYKVASEHVKEKVKKSKVEAKMVEHLQETGLHKKGHVMKVDPEELARGIKVEMEHTSSKQVAHEIALDHLHEDPKYYTHLEGKHMEKAKYTKRTGSPGSYKYYYGAVEFKRQRDAAAEKQFKRNKQAHDAGVLDVEKMTDPVKIEAAIKQAATAMQSAKTRAQSMRLNGRLVALRAQLQESKKKTVKKETQGTLPQGENTLAEANIIFSIKQTLPQDVSMLTISNATSLIKQAVKMPLKTLRRNQDIVEQQKERAYKQKNHKALNRLEVMGDIYTAAVDIKEFKDTTPKEWGEEIIERIGKMKNVKKSRMEGFMERGKSGLALVIFPGELTKAANLSGVGGSIKHPAGLSSVGGKTKSKIPYTSHTERMALAKMAAERMMAPKPENEGKYADTPEVDRKGREKGQKSPGPVGSTGVSGEGSQAHSNFGRETVIVNPTDIGAGRPESAAKYGGVKKVPRKS